VEKNSITKNYINNLVYQILMVISPLITTPYLSRILSVNDIGSYSYSRSITTYFILLGTLGIGFYAQRETAILQGKGDKQKILFWEIILLRAITVTISIIIFMNLYVIGKPDSRLYILLTIEIFSAIFDISWYYQGQERFSSILLCNTIIKILNISSIFIFIKSENDILKYIFIYSTTILINNLSLWLLLPKSHYTISFDQLSFKRHIIPSLSLLLPQAAIQVYTVLDKTMIGIITKSEIQNGYYEQCYKIISIVLMLVTSLGSVLLSRVAKVYAENNYTLVKNYINNSLQFSLFLSIPMTVGLISMSRELIGAFLGESYIESEDILKMLSIIIIFIAISNVFGIQYLVALKRQKEYTISVVVGAFVNIIANLYLIRKFGAFGAAIATVISECLVMGIQMYFVRSVILFKQILKNVSKYIIASGLMVFTLLMIENINLICNTYVIILIKIFAGTSTYFIVLYYLKDDVSKVFFLYVKELLNTKSIIGDK
jgi:O-antigen/teichoic acid export membrane protein